MAAPNFWYSDIALAAVNGNNFMGENGIDMIAAPTTKLNNTQLIGPVDAVATYTWVGTEAAGDIINLALGREGMLITPKWTVASGTTAPAATLTVALGDNDLGLAANLPLVNGQVAAGLLNGLNSIQAPVWVAATTYAAGNVVLDAASTPSNQTYTCILAVSGSTAPHSDTTHWIANQVRYSTSIDIHAASGNVSATGGTQLYGGPASRVPNSIIPGTAQVGFTANSLLNSQYILQGDCWLQATILTAATIAAGAVSVFRIPTNSVN
jgi:hypothetical protein